MDFNRTYIAIRTRGILEILDLSLHVVRDHFVPLLALWLVGVLPFVAANWLATGWMTTDYFDIQYLTLYFFTIAFLIVNQAQIATVFMTTYLGEAMFSQRPSVWTCIKQTLRTNPWIIWFHGFYRGVIPAFAIVLMITEETRGDSFGWLYALFVLMVLFGLIVRSIRPFGLEILLLEKTPVRSSQPNGINYRARSSGLHGANSDLPGRFIAMAIFSVFLTVSFFGSMMLIDSWLNLHVGDSSVPSLIYLPLSMWIVAGLLAIVRFLSYIDIRIRQEGWEVELRMRTESMRLEKVLG